MSILVITVNWFCCYRNRKTVKKLYKHYREPIVAECVMQTEYTQGRI